MIVHIIGSYLPAVWCWCVWRTTHTPRQEQYGIIGVTMIGDGQGEGAIVVPIDPVTQQGTCPVCGDIYRTTDYHD